MFQRRYRSIFYLANFRYFNSGAPLVVCLHGNSSCAETFSEILEISKFQAVAPDLPGCGRSDRLPEYSMEIIAEKIRDFILDFQADKIYVFGHSLGGHLIGFINLKFDGIAMTGTPPLSSAADFPMAFKPTPEAVALIPLLSKETSFTHEEAVKFITHTGITNGLLNQMVYFAEIADGKFRSGCLASLANINQKDQLERQTGIIIFHGMQDGVINPEYLEQINKSCLYQNKIQYLNGHHMLTHLVPSQIVTTLSRAWKFKYSIN